MCTSAQHQAALGSHHSLNVHNIYREKVKTNVIDGRELHQTCGRAWRRRVYGSVDGCSMWWETVVVRPNTLPGNRHVSPPQTVSADSGVNFSLHNKFVWRQHFDNPGPAWVIDFHKSSICCEKYEFNITTVILLPAEIPIHCSQQI